MKLSVLDVFVLSMLDREAHSGYELQRRAGISLGASTPSLRKLLKQRFVSREEGKSATNHRRFEYRLTESGKHAARTAWKALLTDQETATDLDSTLRIADMSAHYGADPQRIKSFLKRAGESRILLADQSQLAVRAVPPTARLPYVKMKIQCDEKRLRAEGDALLTIADAFRRPKGTVAGQQFFSELTQR